MNTATAQKKATMATVKSFIKKNFDSLHINVKSRFDGMVDGCTERYFGFQPVERTDKNVDYTHGVNGAWFVGQSRDYVDRYNENGFEGFQISNSCGRFVLAIKTA